jgi:hypothetical protein
LITKRGRYHVQEWWIVSKNKCTAIKDIQGCRETSQKKGTTKKQLCEKLDSTKTMGTLSRRVIKENRHRCADAYLKKIESKTVPLSVSDR